MMKAKIHFPNYERRYGTNSSVIRLDGIEGYAHLTLCSYSQHHVHWSRLASYLMKSQSRPLENIKDHFTRCKIVLFTPSLGTPLSRIHDSLSRTLESAASEPIPSTGPNPQSSVPLPHISISLSTQFPIFNTNIPSPLFTAFNPALQTCTDGDPITLSTAPPTLSLKRKNKHPPKLRILLPHQNHRSEFLKPIFTNSTCIHTYIYTQKHLSPQKFL